MVDPRELHGDAKREGEHEAADHGQQQRSLADAGGFGDLQGVKR